MRLRKRSSLALRSPSARLRCKKTIQVNQIHQKGDPAVTDIRPQRIRVDRNKESNNRQPGACYRNEKCEQAAGEPEGEQNHGYIWGTAGNPNGQNKMGNKHTFDQKNAQDNQPGGFLYGLFVLGSCYF